MQTHLALGSISEGLQSLHLDPPDCLPFNPWGSNAWLRDMFENVPRYLFRVFTPKSRGETNRIWAKSMDATDGNPNARRDIFARRNKQEVARMLNQHLRWWEGVEDNFVSWTSSLLFALVYIFNRHASERDGSAFEDISLCIVDTTLFPRGVFLRDLDLIEAFREFDGQLNDFGILRREQRGGLFYFGEYLSQGALKIEGKCRIVSAQTMIDRGLYDLQPRFKQFADWRPAWTPPLADPVLKFRLEFYEEPWKVSFIEYRAAIDIARHFGGRWALPVLANSLALRRRRSWDKLVLKSFRSAYFTDNEREDCSPQRTKVVTHSSLPEVQQYAELMHQAYRDFSLVRMKNCIDTAERELRRASRLACNMNCRTLYDEGSHSITPSIYSQCAAMLEKLETIRHLKGVIHGELAELLDTADMTDSSTEYS